MLGRTNQQLKKKNPDMSDEMWVSCDTEREWGRQGNVRKNLAEFVDQLNEVHIRNGRFHTTGFSTQTTGRVGEIDSYFHFVYGEVLLRRSCANLIDTGKCRQSHKLSL